MIQTLDDIEFLLFRLTAQNREMRRLGKMYCPRCAEDCYMGVYKVNSANHNNLIDQLIAKKQFQEKYGTGNGTVEVPNDIRPAAFQFSCTNCPTKFSVLVFLGPDGPEIAIFSDAVDGVYSPLAPKAVNYYLGQAHLAQSVGAYSAAMAMYRSALYQLLSAIQMPGKGLDGMITELEDQISKGAAPKWATCMPKEIFGRIKDIGDIHMHANDLAKLSVLKVDTVNGARTTFRYLLHVIYEEERRLQDLKAKMTGKVTSLKTKPSPLP